MSNATEIISAIRRGCRDKDLGREAADLIEAQGAEIARLQSALGVFADEDAWGGAAIGGERKFWSPFCGENSPAAFARANLSPMAGLPEKGEA